MLTACGGLPKFQLDFAGTFRHIPRDFEIIGSLTCES
jgi:hypothetical protein